VSKFRKVIPAYWPEYRMLYEAMNLFNVVTRPLAPIRRAWNKSPVPIGAVVIQRFHCGGRQFARHCGNGTGYARRKTVQIFTVKYRDLLLQSHFCAFVPWATMAWSPTSIVFALVRLSSSADLYRSHRFEPGTQPARNTEKLFGAVMDLQSNAYPCRRYES